MPELDVGGLQRQPPAVSIPTAPSLPSSVSAAVVRAGLRPSDPVVAATLRAYGQIRPSPVTFRGPPAGRAALPPTVVSHLRKAGIPITDPRVLATAQTLTAGAVDLLQARTRTEDASILARRHPSTPASPLTPPTTLPHPAPQPIVTLPGPSVQPAGPMVVVDPRDELPLFLGSTQLSTKRKEDIPVGYSRLQDAFQITQPRLFGDSLPDPLDLTQRNVGNCGTVAWIQATASREPATILQSVRQDPTTPGRVLVKGHAPGGISPHETAVELTAPMYNHGSNSPSFPKSGVPRENVVWGFAMEKARALEMPEGYNSADRGTIPAQTQDIGESTLGRPCQRLEALKGTGVRLMSVHRDAIAKELSRIEADNLPALVDIVLPDNPPAALVSRVVDLGLIDRHYYWIEKYDPATEKVFLHNPHNRRHPEPMSVEDLQSLCQTIVAPTMSRRAYFAQQASHQ